MRRVAFRRPALALALALAPALAVAGATLAACDPVHSDDIAALGGETPGVPKGPLHRAGQPCTLCHDGAIGDPPGFSIAGTVFATPSTGGASGIVVKMTDATGFTYATQPTNAAGNFYVTPRDWTPAYPITQTILVASSGTVPATMYSQISRSGSCAWCHTLTPGDTSVGPIVLQLDDGGTPL
jgi:hypothetical protein